ncbi:MAG: ABC transporter substrate-binding protein [Burkholderiaceae bacterium]
MIQALRRHFLGLLAVGTLAAIGLSLSAAPARAAQPVRIGLLAFTSHSPTMIADAKGFFADQQLQADFVVFQAAQPMAVAIASGDIDFGVTAISGGLISLAHKGAVKVIGGALQETPEIEGQKVLVSKAAFERGMTSPDKLKGARFGVTTAGSSFHYMAHKLADKSGYARSDLTIVPLQKVPAVIAALKTGQVDAWTIVPNIAAGLTTDGSVVDIGKVADYVDNYQVTTVFTSAAIADKKPELVKRFMLAYSKGSTCTTRPLSTRRCPRPTST